MDLNNLIIGALKYGFAKVDTYDILVLRDLFERKYGVHLEVSSSEDIRPLIKMDDNKVIPKKKIYKIDIDSKIRHFFKELDIKEFILKKLEKLDTIKYSDIPDVFGCPSMCHIIDLTFLGCIKEGIDENQEKNISLSSLGKLYILQKDNREVFDKFYLMALKKGIIREQVDFYLEDAISKNVSFNNLFNMYALKVYLKKNRGLF